MSSQNQHKGHRHKSSSYQKGKQHRKFGNKPFEKLGKDYGKQNKGRGGFMQLEPKKIEDDKKFIDHAKEIAQAITEQEKKPDKKYRQKPNTKNQIRKFYNEFSLACKDESILKLQILRPKISYQQKRGLINQSMAKIIEELIQWVTKEKKFQEAKLFFEAVYGFYGEGK